ALALIRPPLPAEGKRARVRGPGYCRPVYRPRESSSSMRVELIREPRRPLEAEYLFEHALTQEAACAGIRLDGRHSPGRWWPRPCSPMAASLPWTIRRPDGR